MSCNDMTRSYWRFMETYNGRTSTASLQEAFFAGWEAANQANLDRLWLYDPHSGTWRELDRATVTVGAVHRE